VVVVKLNATATVNASSVVGGKVGVEVGTGNGV
jgi:hypothetical protein